MVQPGNPWGRWLVNLGTTDSHLPCDFHHNSAECNRDSGCQWDDSLVRCANTPCLQLCSEKLCMSAEESLLCEYDAKDHACGKKKVCAAANANDCGSDPECWWSTTKDRCEPRPCQHITETACVSDTEEECVWVEDKCSLKKCSYNVSADCLADVECTWDQVASVCSEKPCQYVVMDLCVGDKQCKWESNKCVERPCAQHLDESSCHTDVGCKWDVDSSPAYCTETYCARWKAESDCDGDAACAWDSQQRGCVESRCDRFNGNQCACQEEAGCFWSGASDECVTSVFGACPPLDVAVVFDGSGSMSQAFGRHPHGYEALTTFLKEWVKKLPLNGDSYTAKEQTKATGMRVGFVQFSTPGAPRTTAGMVGTANGLLSGNLSELEKDIEYHNKNQMADRTFVEGALEHAVEIFRASPPTRKRVLILITDGKLNDADMLKAVRGSLDALSVQTFGVVIRRLDTRTQEDIDAEFALKPVVSLPTDEHFLNLKLDDVVTEVFEAICDPTKKFGALIAMREGAAHQPCAVYESAGSCLDDTWCVWSESLLGCVNTPCLSYGCSESECNAATSDFCGWTNGKSCERQPACPKHASPQLCDADTANACRWNGSTCQVRKCNHQAEDSCVTDPEGCEWATDDMVCTKTECTYTEEAKCTQAAAAEGCQWKAEEKLCVKDRCQSATCEANPWCCECAAHADEVTCNHDDKCHWSVDDAPSMCKVKYCSRFSEQGSCSTDPQQRCSWDSVDGECADKNCTKIGEPCPCNKDLGCFWDGSKKECVTGQFGGCPLMDVVIAMDSTTSMQGAFDRHPNGYYAMVEKIRDWVKGIPLSGTLGKAFKESPAQGVRVGVVQFAAEAGAIKSPQGVGSAGHVTGDLDELLKDLDFHEKNIVGTERAYIKSALDLTKGMLGSVTRKRILLVLTDSELKDAATTATVQNLRTLLGMQVQTFGLLLRPTTAFDASSSTAREALKMITSTVQDEHFADATIDELDSILWALCDPHKQFGALIAKSATGSGSASTPCPNHLEKDACDTDLSCRWSDRLLSCADSGCLAHCDNATCAEDHANLCSWIDGSCFKQPICSHADVSECLIDPGCDWNANKVKCEKKKCQHESESGCVEDLVGCEWESAHDACVERPCTYTSQDACGVDAKCTWDSKIRGTMAWGPCVLIPCQASDEAGCLADGKKCEWSTGTPECVPKKCTPYPDEMTCDHDDACHWNTEESPPGCTQKYCSKHAEQAACKTDSEKCKWSGQGCVELKCSDLKDGCSCKAVDRCTWDAKRSACLEGAFGGCPVMDIAVVFDGSGSMSQAFGRHPHGFYAMVEQLRDWVKTLPLSLESAGTMDPQAGGLRVGFIQFSAPKSAVRAPAGTGTGGRFSGVVAELSADLDFHEQAYAMESTYISQALDFAANLFQSSPAGRRKVLLIVTDGKIHDAAELNSARAALGGQGVEVFGVVLRRFKAHSEVDLEAEAVLSGIVSEPKADHYVNIPLDDFSREVLVDICNPNSKFGKIILNYQSLEGHHLPCGSFVTEKACYREAACKWNATQLACEWSMCHDECDEGSCNGAAGCVWDATFGECGRVVECSASEKLACEAMKYTVTDEGCRWYEGDSVCGPPPCTATTEDNCVADPYGCQFDEEAADKSKCVEKMCNAPDPVTCDGKDTCQWDLVIGSCVEKPCVPYKTEDVCGKHSYDCEWKGNTCTPLECVPYTNERDCAADASCEWKTAHAPAHCGVKVCRVNEDKPSCEGVESCVWDEAQRTCDEGVSQCKRFSKSCECGKTSGCMWKDDSCMASMYANCPAVDVVVLMDGSTSMAEVFGRHPHGFLAVTELLLDWVKTLPLADGEGSGAATKVLRTSGFRVGFAQFSASGAAKRTSTEGTKGLLSGSEAQLVDDLHWHEDQFRGSATVESYASQAMEMASVMLDESPADRKKVVIVVADGAIPDANLMKATRGRLEAQRATVFGIQVRRFSRPSAVSESDAETMKALVTEPVDSHFESVEMSELADVFAGLCNEATSFGYYVSEHGEPLHKGSCGEWESAAGCEVDSLCKWAAAGAECVRSACPSFCAEDACAGAAAEERCGWDAGSQSCQKQVCEFATQGACESTTDTESCRWETSTLSAAVCKPNVGCYALEEEVSCNADHSCSWNAAKPACEERSKCGVIGTKPTCDDRRECVWNTATSTCDDVEGCGLYPTESECDLSQKDDCAWSASSRVCIEKDCGVWDEGQKCEAALCVWVDGSNGTVAHCEDPKGCAVYAGEEAKCIEDAVCEWDAGVCKDKTGCPIYKDATICQKLRAPAARCEWDAPNVMCKDGEGCFMYSEMKKCGADDKCEWFEGAALPTGVKQPLCGKKCAMIGEATDCEDTQGCKWEEATCKKNDGCEDAGDRAGCNQMEWCTWDVNRCVTSLPCSEWSTKETCDVRSDGKCEWTGSECVVGGCPALNQTACVEDASCSWNGTCTQAGACKECPAGMSGKNCDQCDFKVVDGSCVVCDRDATCSGKGDCENNMCTCDPGWGGADCSVRMCAPSGAYWYTAYPNKPVKAEMFTVIVHGCFSQKKKNSGKLALMKGQDCLATVNQGCMVSEGSKITITETCQAAGVANPMLEPKVGMELMMNVTAQISGEYTLCYAMEGEKWAPVETHDRAGSRIGQLEVLEEFNDDAGARGATLLTAGEACCEGLQLGEACLPAALILVLWILVIALIVFLAYSLMKSRNENAALDQEKKERKFDDFEMDDGNKKMLDDDDDDDVRSPEK